ncbi:unnamed protein product [Tilletia controversa]|uniref:GPN-loop GTPase 2 n=3 Tax=Tilletia TaxID=13289 RepID=A0A8X7MP13_9BASI|nr:hypothetical protein CF328_g5579 [Tilletia controversa]KAE8194491.1 hypothetical protein CF335_g5331 [Tilletia laevis]KAE8259877.1 hypothetical protein A4X03_0g3970 [Tilletia caries]KAE8243091.1 hypothetical protein A4X06_0g6558 [Tilletia controversa]CAD6891596.1 unnamed protein product [Tilletia caries]
MPFGQVVIGSPGSGKTTYCYGLQQYLTALGRPVFIVNLDPANHTVPYQPAVSLSELITVQDVMEELHLGPNGAMLYCLEYLEANLDWLERKLDELPGPKQDRYVVFDLPGQVELSTNHASLRHILDHLTHKLQWQLVAVHLVDASHITDASRYIALLLLSLRAMLTLELPHVNVLSKMDLLSQMSDQLAFNLDYYTEVQDLSYLLPFLATQTSSGSAPSAHAKRFSKLNQRITELIEDFALVGFETLAVEDRESMARLIHLCDKATGYVYVQGAVGEAARVMEDEEEGGLLSVEDREARAKAARGGTAASAAALFTVADTGSTDPSGSGRDASSHVHDMQERYVDPISSRLWRDWQSKQWEEEGKQVFERRIWEEANKVVKAQGKEQQPTGTETTS